MLIFAAWLAICLSLALINFAESSITSLPAARLKGLRAVMGKPFGDAASRWLHHPEEYLTLLLLVQNILESFYAWFLLLLLAHLIENSMHRQTAAWLAGTLFSLGFLILYPKLLGRTLSHGVIGAWILRILYFLITPFYPILRGFFLVVAKLSGGRPGALGKGLSMSLEEIRELLDGSAAQRFQARIPTNLQMMANYLRLKELRVESIMTPRENVSTVSRGFLERWGPPTPEQERALFGVMTDGHTRTIVVEDGMPVGYLHAKDALRQAVKSSETADIDFASILRPIPVVHAQQTVLGALPLLLRQSPIAFVVKESQWVGIVTSEDVLEEITGEILDEFEHRKRAPRRRSEPGRSAS